MELFNDEIVTKRYVEDGSLRILRREGENSQSFDSDYWEWFREKINYEDEPICLIVVTDIEIFMIDETLIIADICQFNPSLNYQGGNIFTFPSIEYHIQGTKEKKSKKDNTKHSDLANFMIGKMRGYNEQR